MKNNHLKIILKHMLPIGLITLGITILWIIVTSPMILVFILDNDFVLSEYVRSIANMVGIALGISTFILFPVALLGEMLAKKSKHVIWMFPSVLFLCAITVLIIRVIVLSSFFDAILSWSGFILLISGLFLLYWVVLWVEEATMINWRKRRLKERKKIARGG